MEAAPGVIWPTSVGLCLSVVWTVYMDVVVTGFEHG